MHMDWNVALDAGDVDGGVINVVVEILNDLPRAKRWSF